MQQPVEPYEVDSTRSFVRFSQQQLGTTSPITGRDWQELNTRFKRTMEDNDWTWADLVGAVLYIKKNNKKVSRPYGVLYHVQDAKRLGWQKRVKEGLVRIADLEDKVLDAIYIEKDETWVKKLITTRGKMLETTYLQWLIARGSHANT